MTFIEEAIREWVWYVGKDQPEVEWILSDYDSWEKNPHYVGKPGRHPEDFNEEDECEEPWDGFNSDAEADADVLANAGMGTDEDYGCYADDIPF